MSGLATYQACSIACDSIGAMRKRRVLLLLSVLLWLAQGSRADELYGAVHFGGGTNKNPATASAFSAGFHFDPAILAPMPIQVFEVGLSYDRVQSHNGASAEFRARMPFFRCYGWEPHCDGKRFWLSALPSVGKRWGAGGLGGYAGAQIQAVFDPHPEYACCRFAVGFLHRFPFNSSLKADNSLVFELRTVIEFRDRIPAAPPPEHHAINWRKIALALIGS
jgi:hypothetical protein